MKTEIGDLSREWTTEQKMGFVNRTETLPEGVNKSEFLKRFGIPKRKYDGWVKNYGVTSIYSPILDNIKRVDPNVVRMFKNPKIDPKYLVGKKFGYNVSMMVSIGSIEDMAELVTNLQNVPNVIIVSSIGHD